jgi:hypothetical protein
LTLPLLVSGNGVKKHFSMGFKTVQISVFIGFFSFWMSLARAQILEPADPIKPELAEIPAEPVDNPKFKLTFTATIAPDYQTPIPVLPMTLKIFFRERTFTWQDSRNLDKENPPVFSFPFSEKMTAIPSTTISLPSTERTPINTYLRLSGQNVFTEPGHFEDVLVKKENNCLIAADARAICELKIPAIQILGSDSPTDKKVEVKIYRKACISKGSLPFFPVKQDETVEDYLQKFSRDIAESDNVLSGYFLYSDFVFDSQIKEPQMPEEKQMESFYPWSAYLYSKQQSVSRIPLLPSVYRIERSVEDSEGKVEKKFAIVDLQNWGTFIPTDKIEWKDLEDQIRLSDQIKPKASL